jgi:hypothetical protein
VETAHGIDWCALSIRGSSLDLSFTRPPAASSRRPLSGSDSRSVKDEVMEIHGRIRRFFFSTIRPTHNSNWYHGSTFPHRLYIVHNIIVQVLPHPRYRLDPYRRPGLIASTLPTRSISSSRSYRVHATDSIHIAQVSLGYFIDNFGGRSISISLSIVLIECSLI